MHCKQLSFKFVGGGGGAVMVICKLRQGFRYSNTGHLKAQTRGQGQQCMSFVSSIHGLGTAMQISRKLQTGAMDSNARYL